MKLPRPTSLSLFQLFAACIVVALITFPADTIAHGPVLILKGHHGSNGAMAAAGLVAAGLAYKLLTDMGKSGGHHGGGGYGGGGYGSGYAAQMNSFASHDANLGNYGYMPEAHGGLMDTIHLY